MKRYMSRDQRNGFEYLAVRMIAKMSTADPGYKVPKMYDKFIPSK